MRLCHHRRALRRRPRARGGHGRFAPGKGAHAGGRSGRRAPSSARAGESRPAGQHRSSRSLRQARGWLPPVPPVRRIVVVSQQQHAATRVEHDDPARVPHRQPGGHSHPGASWLLMLGPVHVLHCAGHLGPGRQPGRPTRQRCSPAMRLRRRLRPGHSQDEHTIRMPAGPAMRYGPYQRADIDDAARRGSRELRGSAWQAGRLSPIRQLTTERGRATVSQARK